METECSTYTHNTQLELAIDSNDLGLVGQAIQDGADVNEQNSDGNAALHLAIFNNASIDILRTLLTNGASLTIVNKKGETPLQCLQPGSKQTIWNLFKLEKSFDLRDREGNTLIHLLMDDIGNDTWGIENMLISEPEIDKEGDYFKEQDMMIDQFWRELLNDLDNFNIDLNAQNKSGSTPLHMAANYWAAPKHLTAMLTHFDNVNHFLVDCNGDTFLHVYFNRVRMRDDTDFDNCLLEGKIPNCTQPILKKLLACQNSKKDTPFHVFMTHIDNDANEGILKRFLDAGADLNISNMAGETILHCLIRDGEYDISDSHRDVLMEVEPDRIRFLISNGADINSQNKHGDSPLFLVSQRNSVCTLLEMGADIHVRNNFRQTPLLSHLCKSDVDLNLIEMLIDKGAYVNAEDYNGSNALHYAAWYGIRTDVVKLLKQRGVKVVPDRCHQLPSHVAYQLSNKDLFDMLCNCNKNVHEQTDHFIFKKEVVKLTDLEHTKLEHIETIIARFQKFRGNSISKILRLPGLGPVIFEGEAESVRLAVTELVTNICKEVAKHDELLSSSVLQSGSVGENTKVGLPDEFDFVCIFEKLSKMCVVDEHKSACDPGFVYLKLKEEVCAENDQDIFDKEGYLDTFKVRSRFQTVLDELVEKQELFCRPNMIYVRDNFKGANCPTFSFSIRWVGCIFKSLKIDIDLVPACQIKGWWPKNATFHSVACDLKELKEDGALLMLQTEFEGYYEPISKLRISAMKAEKKHMLALPKLARDAYIVSKVLCNNRICPRLKMSTIAVEANEFVTSYMLKICMFHVFDAHSSHSSSSVDIKHPSIDNLYDFVLQIFSKLLQCSYDKNLPSFIFPLTNVFTFCIDSTQEDPIEMCHQKCIFRTFFTKIIMMILGESQNFKSIDLTALLEADALANDYS